MTRHVALIALTLLGAAVAPAPARAIDLGWTLSVIEEDDFYTPDNRDRHYTHGIRIVGTSGDVQDPMWLRPFQWLPLFPDGGPSASRRYEILGGQNMYTPEDTMRSSPDPRDRPYAGWLYGGVGLLQDTDTRQFDRFAITIGTIGPSSGAGQVQTKWHTLIATDRPNGWNAQLRDEPTLDLYRERKWRLHRPLGSALEVDALPQVSLRLGNVYDYVGAGAMVRVGRNLKVDYGPPRIDENLGSTYVNPANGDGGWAWYMFLGTEGRLVGRNIFLDGNSFERSPSVAKEVAVADAMAGAAVVYQHFRLAYTYVYRSNEFERQGHPDHYGSINLTARLAF
jgi:hypothetical protein